jgi:hypothetical protein
MFLETELGVHPNKFVITSSRDGIPEQPIKVLLYQEELPYADRLFTTLSAIDSEWIMFSHEIDIPMGIDWGFLDRGLRASQELKVAKLNLQVSRGGSSLFRLSSNGLESRFLNEAEPGITYFREQIVDTSDLSHDPWIYRHNVNPSILHLPTLLEFLNRAKGTSFRKIETFEIERFFLRYRIINLFNTNPLQCGYYCCAPEYKYFHITHLGKLTRPYMHRGIAYNEGGQAMNEALNFYGKLLFRFHSQIEHDFWPEEWSAFRAATSVE